MKSYKYYVDKKYSQWEREYYNVKAETKEEANEIIKRIAESGENNNEEFFTTAVILFETIEQLTPETNGGESTIEIYNNNGKPLWENKITKTIKSKELI